MRRTGGELAWPGANAALLSFSLTSHMRGLDSRILMISLFYDSDWEKGGHRGAREVGQSSGTEWWRGKCPGGDAASGFHSPLEKRYNCGE